MIRTPIHLKENESCVVLDPEGGSDLRSAGVYRRDTRYLSAYHWSIGSAQVLQCETCESSLLQHFAVKEGMTVLLLLERRLTVRADGFDDHWQIQNVSGASQHLDMALTATGDGRDLFAALSSISSELTKPGMDATFAGETLILRRTASDGVELKVALQPVPASLCWNVDLEAGTTREFSVAVSLSASDDPASTPELPTYHAWRAAIGRHLPRLPQERDQQILERSVDDVRMLLLTTEHGIYPAAGMPHFVTVFGRDALITSMMLLPAWPEVAQGTLRLLAARQGKAINPFHEEEPGKILHEIRRGELSRIGRVPFGGYYGSVDATPLFLMALEAYTRHTGDASLMHELRPAWESAAAWLTNHQQDNDGLISFASSGSGLMVQSWKDSSESMVHEDGGMAPAPLAVAEVQGYAYSAFGALAGFHASLGEHDAANDYRQRAAKLATVFNERFWLEDLGTYAMALDGNGKPLRVLSSDPGHLLWCGIVPQERALTLVKTLMSPPLWSGWGLRTLGSNAKSFNRVSYHNGSVWPHDTALFAAGLARYGFRAEFNVVRDALFDLAASQPGFRLPELISGHAREAGFGPVQYTHACRPQAWAAASIPFLTQLAVGLADRSGSAVEPHA